MIPIYILSLILYILIYENLIRGSKVNTNNVLTLFMNTEMYLYMNVHTNLYRCAKRYDYVYYPYV